jgi:hypothetical protein
MKEEAPLGNPFIGEPRGGRPGSPCDQSHYLPRSSNHSLHVFLDGDNSLTTEISAIWMWQCCYLHGNLMDHMERDKTLSHQVSLNAFLLKATKGNAEK